MATLDYDVNVTCSNVWWVQEADITFKGSDDGRVRCENYWPELHLEKTKNMGNVNTSFVLVGLSALRIAEDEIDEDGATRVECYYSTDTEASLCKSLNV